MTNSRVAKKAGAKSKKDAYIYMIKGTQRKGKVGITSKKHKKGNDLDNILSYNASEFAYGKGLTRKALLFPELLYLLSFNLRKMALAKAFSIGREAYDIHRNGSPEKLFNMLSNGGMGEVTYHSSESRTIISSFERRNALSGISSKVHFFEAALISGYLSGMLGKGVSTSEVKCICNGDEACQFISEHGAAHYEAGDGKAKLSEFPMLFSENALLSHTGSSRISQEYFSIFSSPLYEAKISEELPRMAYLAGSETAHMVSNADLFLLAGKLSPVFGIEKITMKKGASFTAIAMRISEEASSMGNANIAKAFFQGLATTMTDRQVLAGISLGKRNRYILSIKIPKRKIK